MSDLLGVLLGGVLSVAGGAVVQLFQRSEASRSRVSARNQIMRQKAEDCHSAIATVHAACDRAVWDTGRRLDDYDIPYEQTAEYRLLYSKCVTYFPSTIELFERCSRRIAKGVVEKLDDSANNDAFRDQIGRTVEKNIRELCFSLTSEITDQTAKFYTGDLERSGR